MSSDRNSNINSSSDSNSNCIARRGVLRLTIPGSLA